MFAIKQDSGNIDDLQKEMEKMLKQWLEKQEKTGYSPFLVEVIGEGVLMCPIYATWIFLVTDKGSTPKIRREFYASCNEEG